MQGFTLITAYQPRRDSPRATGLSKGRTTWCSCAMCGAQRADLQAAALMSRNQVTQMPGTAAFSNKWGDATTPLRFAFQLVWHERTHADADAKLLSR